MPQKILVLIFLVISAQIAAAQKVPDLKSTEATEKLRTQAVEFLRETQADVGNMHSLENRISFGSEMASLMWFYDEKEAREMYRGVTGDFKQLLLEFDMQMTAIAAATAASEDDILPRGFFEEVTQRSRIQRKFQMALSLRQQIAMTLADHEPDMALAFYYDSVAGLNTPEFRERTSQRDTAFEFQLMKQVAETDAAKAAQFGAKSLDKGVTYQHVDLLRKIYAKNADKGIEFASAIVSHIKTDKMKGTELWTFGELIRFGDETLEKSKKEGGKKPVMETQDLRDLCEIGAQAILEDENPNGMGGMSEDLIEKYAPARAVQIRARFKTLPMVGNFAANAVRTTSVYASNGANSMGMAMTANSNAAAQRQVAARQEREDAEKKLMDDIASLGTKPLAKEEREKVVSQARKIIGQTPGRDKKIAALSLLAGQVAKAGDKELAAEIMKDAESLVNPQPKNYQDFMLRWMLASGYAEVDADKAFPILSDTILRLNDTIAAFVKAAEFFDVQGEILDDGEIQVGQFGGSVIRGLTSELKIAQPTLLNLAKADFVKTKSLTNSFDRPEVRILAKVLILRAILGTKEAKTDDETGQNTLRLSGSQRNAKNRSNVR